MYFIIILLFLCCLFIQLEIQDIQKTYKEDIKILVEEINKLKKKTGVK